jgi:hypothetical protein
VGNDIILKTEGYEISFELKKKRELTTSLLATVGFSLAPTLGKVEVKAMPMPILLRDLERLTIYLEQHIAKLQQDHWSESDTFVPLDLQFQLQALAGEVSSPDGGEFALRFMVNVGKLNSESGSVYVGGEAEVTLEQIQDFISSVRRVLMEMS